MEKQKNLSGKELEEVIENFNFEPGMNYVVLTLNQYVPDNGIEIVSDEKFDLDQWQYVIASGSNRYSAGDKVLINMNKLLVNVPDPHDRTKVLQKINIDPFEFKGGVYTMLGDNMILGKIIEEEVTVKA